MAWFPFRLKPFVENEARGVLNGHSAPRASDRQPEQGGEARLGGWSMIPHKSNKPLFVRVRNRLSASAQAKVVRNQQIFKGKTDVAVADMRNSGGVREKF